MKTGNEHSFGEQPAVHESGTVATGHPANNVITPHSEHRGTGGGAASPARTGGEHGAGADAAQAPGGALRGTNEARRDGVPGDDKATHDASGRGHEAGTRGSGNPVQSGAGQLADDRPGRDAPKGS